VLLDIYECSTAPVIGGSHEQHGHVRMLQYAHDDVSEQRLPLSVARMHGQHDHINAMGSRHGQDHRRRVAQHGQSYLRAAGLLLDVAAGIAEPARFSVRGNAQHEQITLHR
jgi:hypothetical protein